MEKNSSIRDLKLLGNQITNCKNCPRLAEYIRNVAKIKVKRFIDQEYWGKPLSGFGDPNARLLIVGLAPAAHGGNRTGRMFTGDSSGDWVARALYHNGFATKPTSEHKNDGFALKDAYITAVVRCAPPQNKPTKEEFDACSDFLKQELMILKNIKVVVCLGRISFERCCKLLQIKNKEFSHGKIFEHERFIVICSYHPSRQNTQTKRLGWTAWNRIFEDARRILD